MLTDKDIGIKKFILDRLMQIDEEIVEADPEYKQLGKRPVRSVKFEGRSVKIKPEMISLISVSRILGLLDFVLNF